MASSKWNPLTIVALSTISTGLLAACQQSEEGQSSRPNQMSVPVAPTASNNQDSGTITALVTTSIKFMTPRTETKRSEIIECDLAAGTTIKFRELMRMYNTSSDKKVKNSVTGKVELVAPVVVLGDKRIWLTNVSVDSSNAAAVQDSDNPCNLDGIKVADLHLHPKHFEGFNVYQMIYSRDEKSLLTLPRPSPSSSVR
jgi:hypothetical protein